MLKLITDRAEADVLRWQELKSKGYASMTDDERREWEDSKGAYNYTDLNRVEEAVVFLSQQLVEMGYVTEQLVTRVWTENDVPTVADMTRYIQNVKTIRDALSVPGTTPDVPASMHKLTFQGANDIERILLDVEKLIENMAFTFAYSGEIYGGEL